MSFQGSFLKNEQCMNLRIQVYPIFRVRVSGYSGYEDHKIFFFNTKDFLFLHFLLELPARRIIVIHRFPVWSDSCKKGI